MIEFTLTIGGVANTFSALGFAFIGPSGTNELESKTTKQNPKNTKTHYFVAIVLMDPVATMSTAMKY